jgi:glyoxalase family protein
VKKTVNFDDPSAYHLYFGDEEGRPGTILTFFDWGAGIGHGRLGTGVTQHLAFATRDEESLSKWKRRLDGYAVPVLGPFDRKAFKSIYLKDPDGLILEIATRGNGKGYSDSSYPESLIFQWEQEPVKPSRTQPDASAVDSHMRLQGLHHVTGISEDTSRGQAFYTEVLGLDPVEEGSVDKGNARQVYGRGQGVPGTMIGFLTCPEVRYGTVGIGTVHHIAFAVENDEEQLAWRKRLSARGVQATRVLDRKYFKSIYFREPNGLLLEIATIPPGFTVDESRERLGMSLALPEWLEARRPLIEDSLKPI